MAMFFLNNAAAEAADTVTPNACENSAMSWVSHGADSTRGRSAPRLERAPGEART